MAKKRLNQPKPLSEQFHNKALDSRLNYVEGFVRLAVQDLNNITNQLNFLGNVLQAAVNVLGQGAVNAEMERLAKGGAQPMPPSEEQKAVVEEGTGGNETQDRPAVSP